MRLGIRYQLLLPLVILMVGVIGMSTWTAVSSADAAGRHIEKQMEDIAKTAVKSASFLRNHQILHLMKGLSGADFLLCEQLAAKEPTPDGGKTRPVLDDQQKPFTTLDVLPDDLPQPVEATTQDLGPRVHVGGKVYFCRGVKLKQEREKGRKGEGENWQSQPGLCVYVFYPEALRNEALVRAVWPAIVCGGIGGLLSFILSAAFAGRVMRRIQQMERGTRSIAGGDFSPMPLPRRNDELRDLARSINDMAQRLAQLQQAVVHTERLRLLGQVSAGLAHQLRNGVTGANLAVQLHARECSSGADPESLNVALRQLTLVEMHLKRFLNLGKTLELQRGPCRLPQFVDEAVALLGPKCRHAGIDLHYQKIGDDRSWTLLGDSGQLSHMCLNVLTNAIEAAGPGGSVEVRMTRETQADSRQSQAVMEVLDSGPGVAPDIAGRLFEPFVTGKQDGVGLGLAVCHQVAQAHGGRISWSRVGDRTCFRIEIPLLPA